MNRIIKTALTIAIIGGGILTQSNTFSSFKETTFAFIEETRMIVEFFPDQIPSFLANLEQSNQYSFDLPKRLQKKEEYKRMIHPLDTSSQQEALERINESFDAIAGKQYVSKKFALSHVENCILQMLLYQDFISQNRQV